MSEELVAVAVDREICLGVGQCELLAPDSFRLDDDEELVELVGDNRLPRPLAEQVVDRCPSGAITIR